MYERIHQHGTKLLRLFPNATERDPIKLCKRLRTLEGKARQLAEDRCTRDVPEKERDQRETAIAARVSRLLGDGAPWFLNGDPRGYGLKIPSEWITENAPWFYTDWGGYGILAPDLTD